MQLKLPDPQLPAVLQPYLSTSDSHLSITEALRSGMVCPVCGQGKLDYDGLLNLTCPACGFQSGGGAGCT